MLTSTSALPLPYIMAGLDRHRASTVGVTMVCAGDGFDWSQLWSREAPTVVRYCQRVCMCVCVVYAQDGWSWAGLFAPVRLTKEWGLFYQEIKVIHVKSAISQFLKE